MPSISSEMTEEPMKPDGEGLLRMKSVSAVYL
jgi:hypothetical protein